MVPDVFVCRLLIIVTVLLAPKFLSMADPKNCQKTTEKYYKDEIVAFQANCVD
jgi:hypothetical protein